MRSTTSGKKKELSTDKRVYRILPNFNKGCRACNLNLTGAIGGHTFGKISDVELVIVAAYPAKEEVDRGYSLAPNKKRKNIDRPNAGRYLKYSIIGMFDNDPEFPRELTPFYDRIAFTNMIKCSPFNRRHEKLDVTDKHVKTCKQTWLEKEIEQIGKYNPTCPIFLCGSEAVKLLNPKQKVYASRRQVFMYRNTHPVVCTFNPVEVVRYTAYEIEDMHTSRAGVVTVNKVKIEKPIVYGSTAWHWKQDLELIKKLVLANYNFRNGKQTSEMKKLMEYFS